ncbi:DUF2178 domain-containing protein [Natrialba asiatica]|uniref:DUF2178 domain-containing protein n=1 Tax=Natrialba asiatica (strain ATCC 700177 / DSM 12278 / JCM 9576 / FERM P-10747 / NBRC 102637 / 172P1) TaxID=29540 RepID=M0B189_NATA1|nr:DUF2178 domain-containing protein [Natrialba asiatica]ELZ03464.1 hypothetical protein C481_05705 [Natrialba asiatica DSM 12278]
MTETTLPLIRNDSPATYKRLMGICGVAGGLALGIGTALNRPVIAVVLYAVGLTAAVVIPYGTAGPLFDERDDAIHRRASGTTLALFGWLSALVYPSLVVLSGTKLFSWGPASAAVAWTTVVVYGTYAVALGYFRHTAG